MVLILTITQHRDVDMHLSVRSSFSHSKSVQQIGEMLLNVSDSCVVLISCYHKNYTQAAAHHGLRGNSYQVGQTPGVFSPSNSFRTELTGSQTSTAG